MNPGRFLSMLMVFCICGAFPVSVHSMDVKKVFLEADKHYMKGSEPEEALRLYQEVIADGTNPNYVRLSKFKSGIILDEQMMKYEEAIRAYQEFIDRYPNVGLAEIAKKNKEYLQSLQAAGALDAYRNFRTVESKYLLLMQKEGVTEKEKKDAAKALYKYALHNYQQPYNRELLRSTLSETANQRLWLLSNHIIRLIDKKLPELKDVYEEVYLLPVKIQSMRIYIRRTAEAYLALCVLLVLVRKGWRNFCSELRRNIWFYAITTVVVFIYMLLWYIFVVTKDTESTFDLVSLAIVYGMYVSLMFLSILLYGSFSTLKNGAAARCFQFVLGALAGVSLWAIFAYYFDYLWLFGF